MRPAAPWAFVLLLQAAVSLSAQEGVPPLGLAVAPGTGELTLFLGDFIEDGSLRNALVSGLPVRVRVVAELWRDGLFDSERGRGEWRATVVYDPLGRTYRVGSTSSPEERVVPSLSEVTRVLQESLTIPLSPVDGGRYYYLGRVEVETLSLSDLEELGRWLRGDLAPVVAGEEDVEGAVAKGVRRLVVRVLGLPARRFRVRTPSFEVGGAGEGPGTAPGEPAPGERAASLRRPARGVFRTRRVPSCGRPAPRCAPRPA